MTIDLKDARRKAQEAQERAAKATLGPWRCGTRYEQADPGLYVRGASLVIGDESQDWITSNEDAEFIAASRTDVPELAALVRDMADEIERLRPFEKAAVADFWDGLNL